MSVKTLWIVHIVPQQSHTNLSVRSVYHVNYLVSQFELFIHVFALCSYQHWGQIFLSGKVCCCIDKLIPQKQKLAENYFSHCKILDQSELFVVVFLEYFEFHTQVVGIIFGQLKSSRSVLKFAKVHIVRTSWLV